LTAEWALGVRGGSQQEEQGRERDQRWCCRHEPSNFWGPWRPQRA